MYTSGEFEKRINEQFDGVSKISFHLAPPLLSWWHRDKQTGHPYKVTFGPWMIQIFRVLAKFKKLRGTSWDIFGYTQERKLERQMISDYEALLDRIMTDLSPATHATIVELAELPLEIKGFGHVKLTNYTKTKKRQKRLLEQLDKLQEVKEAAE